MSALDMNGALHGCHLYCVDNCHANTYIQNSIKDGDEVHSTTTDNFITAAKYVVPARRHVISHTDKKQPFIFSGENSIQIAPADQVEPKFRTPCRYTMVGTIKVQF